MKLRYIANHERLSRWRRWSDCGVAEVTKELENNQSHFDSLHKLSSLECSAQGQVLHCKRRNQGCSSAEGRSYTANSATKVAVLTGMVRCGSFPLLSSPHSLFGIWTDIKRSENIPEKPRWDEWKWLTGPSGLHRNSPRGLISVLSGFSIRSEIWKSQLPFAPSQVIADRIFCELVT